MVTYNLAETFEAVNSILHRHTGGPLYRHDNVRRYKGLYLHLQIPLRKACLECIIAFS